MFSILTKYQQININLIDFDFSNFVQIFLKIGISTLNVGNDASSVLVFELFIFFSFKKVQNYS